jgi:hypothetical protein
VKIALEQAPAQLLIDAAKLVGLRTFGIDIGKARVAQRAASGVQLDRPRRKIDLASLRQG